jgi:hypothetical protein
MTVSKWTTKAQGGMSPKSGRGLFATDFIKKSEWIAEWAGEVARETTLSMFPPDRQTNCVQVGSDTYLVPTTLTDGDYVNHSCDPNSGMQGENTLIALRDIQPGEEITYDYAMTDTSPYDEFRCCCGASVCRHQITGNDWRQPELRLRYEGYFSAYVKELIRKEVEQCSGADARRGTQ